MKIRHKYDERVGRPCHRVSVGGFDADYKTLRAFQRVLVRTGLTAAARVRAQVRSYGICGELKLHWGMFFSQYFGSPPPG
jgi:hypothetical protein